MNTKANNSGVIGAGSDSNTYIGGAGGSGFTTPTIEKILEDLDIICKQADQCQKNAGYPVTTPAKELLRWKLTTLQSHHEEEVKKAVDDELRWVKMILGYKHVETVKEMIDEKLQSTPITTNQA